MQDRQPPQLFSQETAPGDRLRSAEFRSNSFERCRGGGFTLANYRVGRKCTSRRGWLLFHGATPSSARSPESSRICGATLHLENEPAPYARRAASCLP